MKNSMGIVNTALARAVRNEIRAMHEALFGIGVPFSTLALVQAIMRFWMRQTTEQHGDR